MVLGRSDAPGTRGGEDHIYRPRPLSEEGNHVFLQLPCLCWWCVDLCPERLEAPCGGALPGPGTRQNCFLQASFVCLEGVGSDHGHRCSLVSLLRPWVLRQGRYPSHVIKGSNAFVDRNEVIVICFSSPSLVRIAYWNWYLNSLCTLYHNKISAVRKILAYVYKLGINIVM